MPCVGAEEALLGYGDRMIVEPGGGGGGGVVTTVPTEPGVAGTTIVVGAG